MSGYLSSLLPAIEDDRAFRKESSRYLRDPVLWAERYLGIQLWSAQKKILYSIRDNRNTAVAAGHGVGKSFVVAVACAWWIDVHPKDVQETFVATTAPFQDQITTILWDNMRSIHANAMQRYKEKIVDHPLPGYITGDNKWKLDNGQTIAQGRKPPDNKADSGYQGKHATYLLAIGDEAAGLGKDMIDALGNISTGPENRMVLIANPTDPTSEMAKIWKNKMASWVTMHISVYDSPLITHEEGFDTSKAGGMSGRDYIAEALEKYGSEDDPRFIARVLGQWAFDAGNNVFSDEDIARAVNTIVMPDPGGAVEFGCDIARMGVDGTFVYMREFGDVWETDPETTKPIKPLGVRGSRIRYLGDWKKAPLTGDDPKNLGSAQRINSLALAEGAYLVKVDAAGMGAGVIDGLATLAEGRYDIFEVWGSAASSDTRAYSNHRAEQFFGLKEKMFSGILDLDGKDEDLLDELRAVVYEYNEKGAAKIESKDSMKKRGAKSPDRADALWYSAWDVDGLLGPRPGDMISPDLDELLDEIHPFYQESSPFASAW